MTGHLQKAILSQSHESNRCCGDEDSCNGNEAADEDKETQEANARNLENPHA